MAGTMTRRIKRRLAAGVARFLRRPKLTVSQLGELSPACILIVRQHNQMGDMVCATPALRALKEKFPTARLILVTSPVNGAVVRHDRNLDTVLTFSQRMWRRPWALMRFIRALRRPRCELAFVLCSVSFSVTSAAIALACGARWIVGPDSLPYGWDISRHIFALEMPGSPVMDRPAVEHGLAPLQAVGIDTADHAPRVEPAPGEREQAREVMSRLGLGDGFWALHPGAGKRQNVWPPERFAVVAARAAAAGRQVLILYGPADGPCLDLLRQALDKVSSPSQAEQIMVAPQVAVGVGAALLERAERFLCNDTGVMHVAGAVGTPTLALFGPTDPALWKPPSPLVRALRSSQQQPDTRGPEFGWMESIRIAEVWQAWSTLPLRQKKD